MNKQTYKQEQQQTLRTPALAVVRIGVLVANQEPTLLSVHAPPRLSLPVQSVECVRAPNESLNGTRATILSESFPGGCG